MSSYRRRSRSRRRSALYQTLQRDANCLICALTGKGNYAANAPDSCNHPNADKRRVHEQLMAAGRKALGVADRLSLLMGPVPTARDLARQRRTLAL